ncbi:shikimate dehydrogenase [Desulfonatronovibrio hydrogenovorans]|uniref:shikimate dehydrogenase n=1 Tax=Desulfonatronovibrio hydrogenovorans TaxID=53245 RepID=UPI00048CCC15|nr:shikimate dehydrogenase [Desulfonatronovibrio hydrogenovorans]
MYQAYGVLGHPLGHSLSPLLHNLAFEQLGMKRSYFRWQIKSEDLPFFMKAVRILPLSGVSVTIPYKEKIMPFLDEISPEAREIGAVNTLYWDKDRLWGTNTDYLGFMAPIREMKITSALVLGAGGASRSVLYGLKKLGVKEIYLCNRNREKADQSAKEFDVERVDWSKRRYIRAGILVNTTPLGTKGDNQDLSPWDLDAYPFKVVYDLVYNPVKTRLLRSAEQKGVTVVSGLSMFVHQAREQFRTWTGEVFDPDWAEEVLHREMEGI